MKKYQKGVAAIELAIIIPILLLIVFGVTEFGRAIYQYNTIAKSTRDSARYLSMRAPGSDWTTAKTRIENSAEPLLGDNTFTIQIFDSSNSNDHTNVATGTGLVNLVTVQVSGYQFTSLVPFIPLNVTFAPISVTMRQAL